MKRLLVNVRLGSWQLQSASYWHWPLLTVRRNAGHAPKGEFRTKPGWKPFAVYSLMGWAPHG